MARQSPVRMICIYHVKKGAEAKFKKLLTSHWPALHAAGLATAEPATVMRGEDKSHGRVAFVEQFSWINAKAAITAHYTPEVREIWDPMMPLLEDMEFLKSSPVAMPFGATARR